MSVTKQPFDSKRVQGIDYNNDTEHANHPFHSTLEKHGFKYDYTSNGGEHHYQNPGHKVPRLFVGKNKYQGGKPFFSGQGIKQGDDPAKLDAQLAKKGAKKKMAKESLVKNIVNKNGMSVQDTLNEMLKNKTLRAISEIRKEVVSQVYVKEEE